MSTHLLGVRTKRMVIIFKHKIAVNFSSKAPKDLGTRGSQFQSVVHLVV